MLSVRDYAHELQLLASKLRSYIPGVRYEPR